MKIFIDLYGMLEFSSLASFQGLVCFRNWEGGFESNNGNEILTRNKPLVVAIRKFHVATNTLAQVGMEFCK
jgi:hypothetical protein